MELLTWGLLGGVLLAFAIRELTMAWLLRQERRQVMELHMRTQSRLDQCSCDKAEELRRLFNSHSR